MTERLPTPIPLACVSCCSKRYEDTVLDLRDETTGKNLIVTTSNGCNLDNNTDDEHTSRAQDTIFSRQDFGYETGKESSEPSSKLEDSSEPSLLCRIVNVAVRFCDVSELNLHKT
jgi:hypothetical protein